MNSLNNGAENLRISAKPNKKIFISVNAMR
jgi:hypothetical protein